MGMIYPRTDQVWQFRKYKSEKHWEQAMHVELFDKTIVFIGPKMVHKQGDKWLW